MAFASQIYKDEVIINDDDNTMKYAEAPDGMGRGLLLDMRGPNDYEYGEFAAPFPAELIVPQSEWEARIKEMEEQKTRMSDRIRQAKLDHKDQASTNYCWINAPVHCVEINRMQQNQKPVTLSPASAGAKIKNFRNVGGWGLEGVKFLAQNGCVPVSKWPANAIDKKYDTPENAKLALDYIVKEWVELKPRNVEQMISLLLRRIPLAGGYNWWRHEVTNCDPVWIDGGPAVRIRNSWKGWGDYGFGILQGNKMLADDLVGLLNSQIS